jgi:hypothetical protein
MHKAIYEQKVSQMRGIEHLLFWKRISLEKTLKSAKAVSL